MGGKSREAAQLVALLPEHSCYIEVFGGAASVLLAKSPAPVEVYNDVDGELVNFFSVMKNAPEAFKRAWSRTLTSREEFDRLAELNPQSLDPIQRAFRYLYINRLTFGGVMDHRPSFGLSGKGPPSLHLWLANLEAWTDFLHWRLTNCYIERLDFRGLIGRWESIDTGPGGKVYFLDPPYLGTTGYSPGEFTEADHQDLAVLLRALPSKWLLTVNDHPLMRDLYAGCNIQRRSKSWSVGGRGSDRGRRRELVICNY